jgi:hypothetical protein
MGVCCGGQFIGYRNIRWDRAFLDCMAAVLAAAAQTPTAACCRDLRAFSACNRGRGLTPTLQDRCDELAGAAHARAAPMSLPCPESLRDETLLFLGGALVVDVGRAFDCVYRALVAPLSASSPPATCWPAVLQHADCSNAALRWFILLRSALHTRDLLPHGATCPLCGFAIPNWGWHVLHECILLGELRNPARTGHIPPPHCRISGI